MQLTFTFKDKKFISRVLLLAWLRYLIPKPLFKHEKITVNEDFFNDPRPGVESMEAVQKNNDESENPDNDDLEEIDFENVVLAQQQTLLWNENKYLRIAPRERNVPKSLLFDEFAEELTFSSIYLGEFRHFRPGFTATPFQISSSEVRRKDSRACRPQHLLYMAMKILRLRVRDSLSVAFKHVGKDCSVTREDIESKDYVDSCIEHNLSFLKSIPNSAYYWLKRKKDLFAMLRQLGKPTMFLIVSANETEWPDLIKTIYRFKNNGATLTDEEEQDLHFLEKYNLVNEDSVTCALYFNKMVNI